MTEHRYDDEEVHEIFARAAGRQKEAERAESASQAGLSLAELQHIGSEAGIDPDLVADAARALALQQPGGALTEPVNPWEVSQDRMLPGPVSGGAWEQIVGDLRRTFKKNGIVSEFGDAREWHSGDDIASHPIRLRMEPSGEGTHVSLRQDVATEIRGLYVALSIPGVMAVLFTVITLVGNEPRLWGMVGAFGMAALLGLIGLKPLGRRWMAKQSGNFSAVTDRIELIVRRDTMLTEGGEE